MFDTDTFDLNLADEMERVSVYVCVTCMGEGRSAFCLDLMSVKILLVTNLDTITISGLWTNSQHCRLGTVLPLSQQPPINLPNYIYLSFNLSFMCRGSQKINSRPVTDKNTYSESKN